MGASWRHDAPKPWPNQAKVVVGIDGLLAIYIANKKITTIINIVVDRSKRRILIHPPSSTRLWHDVVEAQQQQ